ncbi:MAG: methionine adenosyltransferase [Candidatus Omnitrophica bacterium CG11_big_fil_rev_8_21_14_0_20_64_10]|nr:MAG: methionine adenosyltransferase [Candidatus Omnitrophica bacterium CG11_big_fil_rev_8_21_14_0_20_64_10]
MRKQDKSLFTSESVTEGHPDKLADQISDGILDAIYKEDPEGRVACETLVTTGLAFVAGEVTTSCYVDVPRVVRSVIHDVGYNDPHIGFDSESCGVVTAIQGQSPDIALGVDTGGAGDQGMMFGYATNETPELMPLPITLAHRLVRRVTEVRKNSLLPYLRPDGKSQVTVEYVDDKPVRISAVVVSVHHGPKVTTAKLRREVREKVINPILPKEFLSRETKYYINPTGRFEVGGPVADTGLTGRKIIVDTYGGLGRAGGGCFSGKDPTKVDRSAAYMARYVAKNIVAAGLAERCEVQFAYAIGVAEPVSVRVETFGTGKVSEASLTQAVRRVFNLTPAGIIRDLKLRRPIYRRTAAYGHFGRDEEGFTWEQIDKVSALKKAAK